MRSRFLASLFVAAVAAAYAAPAGAEPAQWTAPPKTLPHVQHGDTPRNLDFLFGALKVAPNRKSRLRGVSPCWTWGSFFGGSIHCPGSAPAGAAATNKLARNRERMSGDI